MIPQFVDFLLGGALEAATDPPSTKRIRDNVRLSLSKCSLCANLSIIEMSTEKQNIAAVLTGSSQSNLSIPLT
jgi:hypothetical protein